MSVAKYCKLIVRPAQKAQMAAVNPKCQQHDQNDAQHPGDDFNGG
jgi:hypothetical protein